jgi:hypothetical protein
MSEIFSERFSIVSKTTCKRNQWQRQLGSFRRTGAEALSRAQSGLRVMGYVRGKVGPVLDIIPACRT